MKGSMLLVLAGLMALAAAAPPRVAAQILTVTDPGNEGPGTLRDLVAQAPPGARIELPLETVRLEREIVITKNLTIVGGRISG